MQIDTERLRQELKRIKELIASDPEVLAQFDADGNGVIDGEEWEVVRQVVIRRLEREAAEAELARQLYDQLDPEQAAELARLEAAMAEEGAEEPAPAVEQTAHAQGASSLDERDWGELELAIDPHQDAAAQRGRIAEELYQKELVERRAARAGSVRLSEHGTLADCMELVLEQSGGVKQLFGNMFRREYVVRDPGGHEIGRINQRENEALQNLTDYSILEDPDLHFNVFDDVAGETFQLRRTSGLADNSITVFNPRGMAIAQTSWTLSFVRRKYEVRVTREGVSYYVRRRFLKPWTFDVLDPFEEPIGEMQRGWSGMGFLTGGNLFYIGLAREVSPGAMWGLLATALLADLDSEKSSRGSALDFFND